MRQKLVRIQMSHQESSKKMLIFSQIFFIPVLIIPYISLNFPQSLNSQTKKGDRNSKENHRPVGILLNISKIFERCMFRQIYSFMNSYQSKQQYGFRKGYSPQYWLLVMLEKWKNAVDKGKCFGAFMTDLSKTFNCLSHELLIAKLHASGSDLPALKLIQSCLSNRKENTNINATYS